MHAQDTIQSLEDLAEKLEAIANELRRQSQSLAAHAGDESDPRPRHSIEQLLAEAINTRNA